MYALTDYHYDLPPELIAQTPAERREDSRLLRLNRSGGGISHHVFSDLSSFLNAGDTLVVNNTRVVPGRLLGKKSTGGRVEALILDYGRSRNGNTTFECLIKASKRPRPGTHLFFDEGLSAEVTASGETTHTVAFTGTDDFDALLHRIGRVPLPPYIRRNGTGPPCDDRTAYQTVYAARKGAIAAPTAGLHFTEGLLNDLRSRGVRIAEITLHVGYGTFVPVRVSDIRHHVMHTEWFEIPETAARILSETRKRGRRIVAVGTTAVRTLEFAADDAGNIAPGSGQCDLFIYPGYRFKVVDAMVTNFHLPESTLLMLVSAFAGRENILSAYRAAIDNRYRFFSYGDAMLID